MIGHHRRSKGDARRQRRVICRENLSNDANNVRLWRRGLSLSSRRSRRPSAGQSRSNQSRPYRRNFCINIVHPLYNSSFLLSVVCDWCDRLRGSGDHDQRECQCVIGSKFGARCLRCFGSTLRPFFIPSLDTRDGPRGRSCSGITRQQRGSSTSPRVSRLLTHRHLVSSLPVPPVCVGRSHRKFWEIQDFRISG